MEKMPEERDVEEIYVYMTCSKSITAFFLQ
jgi:hypothetical protein